MSWVTEEDIRLAREFFCELDGTTDSLSVRKLARLLERVRTAAWYRGQRYDTTSPKT